MGRKKEYPQATEGIAHSHCNLLLTNIVKVIDPVQINSLFSRTTLQETQESYVQGADKRDVKIHKKYCVATHRIGEGSGWGRQEYFLGREKSWSLKR